MFFRTLTGFSIILVFTSAWPAHAASDFNSSRSNRERGNLSSPPAPPQDAQEAQDFNATRSNRDKGAVHVHGDPHVDQKESIAIDEAGVHRSSSRVLPTVNKRTAPPVAQDAPAASACASNCETEGATCEFSIGEKGDSKGDVACSRGSASSKQKELKGHVTLIK